MSLFKISRGAENKLPSKLTDGYAYFTTDNGNFYIDHPNAQGVLVRSQLSAEFADKLRGVKDGATITILPEQIVKFTDLTWSNILDKPTTIAGYGITDAYTKSQINEGFATITHTHDQYLNVSGTVDSASTVCATNTDIANLF